ncbi:hybrid sensor histidine kinase/response regulator [Pseudomonas oryzihabitans]|uniref:ATP-binding response regulator n=1 Tax=Pseudomonas oryzihabitans TaxID=47885 RepID=UPI002893C5C1|nr:hybrid sensor histidine kinase/response regulator [Pseudomonas oryzihabitans]MDT3721880.1 hybrid sensor histidine kinase/response regulator [Pseudomonas oryzihabitans]
MTDEGRIQSERLRLILQGIDQSLWVGILLSTLLFGVFLVTGRSRADDAWPLTASQLPLALWYLAFLACRFFQVGYCRRRLRQPPDQATITPTVRVLVLSKLAEGLIWGSLAWIGLRDGVPASSIALLLALMAAISSNAVSMLSPILRLYLSLMLPMLSLTMLRLMLLDELTYRAIGVCCLLYVIGQYGQARLVGGGINTTIRLRFENLDLIERLQHESQMASAAREAAEQANEAKSRFLAAASHDLRQPIHAQGLFLEALSYSRLDEHQHQVLASAKAAGLASADMLNTLLDFSRIEAGVVQPSVQPVDLHSLFCKMELDLAPQADARGLIYRCRETELQILSDPALLELILRNLITNAIRYTERGGLLIAARRRRSHAILEVVDTGIGIAADQQREIFREFHQLGNSERDRRKGLGLGLAIVEGLARSLGHRLTLVSRVGRGSTFRLEVPIAPLQPLAPYPDRPPPDTDTALQVRGCILVVDDDEAIRLGMQQLLESWGCTCVVAESYDAAVALPWRAAPTMIICDYRLRDQQTGAQVIRALREHFARELPALLITGDTAPERLSEAASSGIPLLHKPVTAKDLRRALGALS